MKSLFISTLIIVILLSSWVFLYFFISESTQEFNTLINDMENNVYTEKWSSTLSLYDSINSKWEKRQKTLLLVLDHEEIEKINLSFKKLREYISVKNKSLIVSEIASLKFFFNHIKEKESLSLRNIF